MTSIEANPFAPKELADKLSSLKRVRDDLTTDLVKANETLLTLFKKRKEVEEQIEDIRKDITAAVDKAAETLDEELVSKKALIDDAEKRLKAIRASAEAFLKSLP